MVHRLCRYILTNRHIFYYWTDAYLRYGSSDRLRVVIIAHANTIYYIYYISRREHATGDYATHEYMRTRWLYINITDTIN
jgi:hypothetical protein